MNSFDEIILRKKLIQAIWAVAYAIAFVGMVLLYKPAHAMTVWNDNGGEVLRYALNAKRLTKYKQTVRFDGVCASACTLYLSVPALQQCATRRAVFKFHAPYSRYNEAEPAALNYMMKSYPAWVRRWIAANGGLTRRTITMRHSVISKHMRSC